MGAPPGNPQRAVQHLGSFEYINDETTPMDTDMLALVSELSGGDPELIQQFMGIIPYFTLFHSFYLRAITKSRDLIDRSPHSNNSVRSTHTGYRRWAIPRDNYNKEYAIFLEKYAARNGGITLPEAKDQLAEINMGQETRDRFYDYFCAFELPEGITNLGTPGSCAWPLGCVQNLPPEEFRFSEALDSQDEHGRPESLIPGRPNQYMCALHNQWKRDNLLFDVQGILYCIFGLEEDG